MTPERWRRIEDLFHAASERAPEERRTFLDRECGGDTELRVEVDSLLAQRTGTLLREGIIGAAAALVGPTIRVNHEGHALGPYVLGPILGAGGMCDVYRAHDAKLGRDVAVKILPRTFDEHPERLARFEREARILASLNHPNIAVIHGLEDSDGIRGLVLELVDGVTLKEKLASGALPAADALAVARQVADALQTAHRKGIVHRDLKPANIKINSSGVPKVLDFGLAKMDGDHGAAASVLATAEGLVLGTVAYMSPEQARGLPVDKRTDIWAFGCILYEMLTGVRPFPGDSAADVLGAITAREPDWALLPRDMPGRVRHVLRRCLTKDPDRRLHDIAEARIEIEAAIAGEGLEAEHVHANSIRAGGRRHLVPWVLSGLTAAVAPVAVWWAFADGTSRSPMRLSIELPSDLAIALGDARGSSVAVAPDGGRIVYVAATGGRTQLYMRPIGELVNTPIAGTEGGTSPFFSPDGRWIAFHADGKLKKVPLLGGAAVTIVEGASRQVGAAWGPDDSVLFVPESHRELWRVPASGGTAERVTSLGEGEMVHSWPQFLPGGSAVLYTVRNTTNFEGGRIVVESRDGSDRAVLVERASYGRVALLRGREAYLIYARREGLFAAPFSLETQRLTGPESLVQNGVMTNLSGGAHYSFSPSGLLAYVPGELNEDKKTPLWVGRDGTVTEQPTIPGLGFVYRVSPDGRRLARPDTVGPHRNIWIDDLANRGPSIQLTFGGVNDSPVWTHNGSRVIYSRGAPNFNLFWRAADLSDDETRLTRSPNHHIPGSVSPDGKTLAYTESNPERGRDIWLLPLQGSHELRTFVSTPRDEGNPRFSPDGRWLSFMSNISGRPEIYLAPFPGGGRRIPVSKGFGMHQLWSPDGRELFYRSAPPESGGGNMMAVTIDTTGPEPRIGTPRVLFPGPYQGFGDIGPDGRFLLLKMTPFQSTARVIQVVLNWHEELQAKVTKP